MNDFGDVYNQSWWGQTEQPNGWGSNYPQLN